MESYRFTPEEAVLVKQFINYRKELSRILIELHTHDDAILTILRGHQASSGYTDDNMVFRSIVVLGDVSIETIKIEPMPCKN